MKVGIVMVCCCVLFCSSEKGKSKGISFHQFPVQKESRDRWLTVISRQGFKGGSTWVPSECSVVCSLHFQSTDFSVSTSQRQLLPNVFPSVFHDYYPARKKPKLVPDKRNSPKKKCEPEKKQDTSRKRCFVEIAPDDNSVELNSHLNYCISKPTQEKSVQVSAEKRRLPRSKIAKNYQKKTSKLRKTVQTLRSKVKASKLKIKEMTMQKQTLLEKQVKKIESASKMGDFRASFLVEQINAFGKKKPHFLVNTLKICVVWQKQSPKGYNFARKMNILHLPHKTTLKRFIGFSNGETGISSLAKQRLATEFKNLSSNDMKFASLILDEMAIKTKMIYDRKMDMYLGQRENTDEAYNACGLSDLLANRLLCFVLKGLSTNYVIPVAFFFVTKLDSNFLYGLTKEVIRSVEDIGFRVIRIVADNGKVNVGLFKQVSDGTPRPEIPHPLHPDKSMFLAFDQSHIIKNVRSQHLEKVFHVNDAQVSSSHVKVLYELQKNQLIKPVRFLTRKHLFPTNMEKMNVGRAVQLFSSQVTAALTTMGKIAPEKVSNLNNLEETVKFMTVMRKWFDIHDVCNKKQAYFSRSMDKLHFFAINDERLEWLENTFIPYIEAIQKAATNKREAFSDETYQALLLTSRSTVLCVRFLLKSGFHYVLSRKFSSDDIEGFFSHLRQMGGYNDTMDARSCLHAIESTLHTGIIVASSYSNVGLGSITGTKNLSEAQKARTALDNKENVQPPVPQISGPVVSTKNIPPPVLSILQRMDSRSVYASAVTMKKAAAAMLAGFLVLVLEENTNCMACLDRMSSPASACPIMLLIHEQDRGGLHYPSRLLVDLLEVVIDFTKEAVPYILSSKQVLRELKTIILPRFFERLKCQQCENRALIDMLLVKCLRPLLDNYAKDLTDQAEAYKKLFRKPLHRKVLRL